MQAKFYLYMKNMNGGLFFYGVERNVVKGAKIKAKKTEYKAAVLDYLQIQELIREACKLEDPTFLYMVVMSMTQGLRRGAKCCFFTKNGRKKKHCHTEESTMEDIPISHFHCRA